METSAIHRRWNWHGVPHLAHRCYLEEAAFRSEFAAVPYISGPHQSYDFHTSEGLPIVFIQSGSKPEHIIFHENQVIDPNCQSSAL